MSIAIVTIVLSVSPCLSTQPPAHISVQVSPGAPPATTMPVPAQAAEFMSLFDSGDFVDQWNLLSPLAKAQWPSAQARAAMLTDKFAESEIIGYSLGKPMQGASWASPENLASQAGLWRVPVGLEFCHSPALQPMGVAFSYQNLHLFVSCAHVTATTTVMPVPRMRFTL